MKQHYYFRPISRTERKLLGYVLLEELDHQSWYTITWIALLGGEMVISIQ